MPQKQPPLSGTSRKEIQVDLKPEQREALVAYMKDLDEQSRSILHVERGHTEPDSPECPTCIQEDKEFREKEGLN